MEYLNTIQDIQQWSILAIHNICEGNNDSKSVLSGLKFNGLAEEAETLKKYGIKAEVKDKKIVVRPPDPQWNEEDRLRILQKMMLSFNKKTQMIALTFLVSND